MPSRARSTSAYFFPVLLTGFFAINLWADGPKYLIPEPPEKENALLLESASEIEKIRFATSGRVYEGTSDEKSYRNTQSFKKRPPQDKKKDEVNGPLLEEFTLLCIRYLREYDRYAFAPDSPDSWKTFESRERMEANAIAYLALLSKKDPHYLELIVEAWADTHRFASTLQSKAKNPKIKNFIQREKELYAYLEERENTKSEPANKADPKAVKSVDNSVAKVPMPNEVNALLKALKLDLQKPNKWGSLASDYNMALVKIEEHVPNSFLDNNTGDIPLLQDAGPSRIDSVIHKIGKPVLPYLAKMRNHRNRAVAERANQLCEALGMPPQAKSKTKKEMKQEKQLEGRGQIRGPLPGEVYIRKRDESSIPRETTVPLIDEE